MTIQEEQKAFEAQLDELLRERRGRFVLFKDGRPVEFFASQSLAYAEGVARFGATGTFLVAPVEREAPRSVSLAWEAGVMVG